MFRIHTPNGETFYTDDPKYIRLWKNGCYIICDRKKAEGVAYGGKPYLFKEGTVINEIDSGSELMKLQEENTSLKEQLAATDEATIELFETALTQEEINAEQDEAIIGIYESLEVAING